MDLAYDHIQEEALSPDEPSAKEEKKPETTINADFQEAYKAISSSPWGARLGGFFGSVVKQGESVYKEAQKELTEVGQEASQGFTDLRSSIIKRTRGLSLAQTQATGSGEKATDAEGERELSTYEALKESEGVLARLRSEAAKRLKEIEKAEDAADEALLKFGTNIRNFLRDAVTIASPSAESGKGSTVLFESKDASGKRVIHTTRFDAQLHVIHSSLDSFTKDPVTEEYEPWTKTFNVESKTEDISKDLENFGELRTSMEKLVPDTVTYEDFWKRYYFLRHSIETAEARRRELLKGAAAEAEEEVGWDEDSEDEGAGKATKAKTEVVRPASTESSTTLHPAIQAPDHALLKPEESRKSHDEKSQADSDGSYDVVGAASGAPSRAPGSPKDSRKGEDSEEEDWE
ncbi:BSD-domain-containing protein [Mollisia scopiformis]|uniref:BSD-domain-containing protein n=1 Tax=Mollisia scopiformis TaxID=149040 RepID=A0A194XTI1_MOLSC|nr:BSD-domain-containing protein [Mollisia scopiformis]KUJ23002.1 BSD-domain-containing protein [Mollisia scopiformis]